MDFDAEVPDGAPDAYNPAHAHIDLDRHLATGKVLPHLRKYGNIPQPRKEDTFIFEDGKIRMQVLGDGIVRVEYDGDGGGWEDRASFVVVDRGGGRDLNLKVKKEREGIALGSIIVKLKDRESNKEGLSRRLVIESKDIGNFLYERGQGNKTMLGGSCRTLDESDGYNRKRGPKNKIIMKVPLTTSVVNRTGITFIEDSESPLFDEHGWFASRPQRRRAAYEDVYVLVYGSDYQKALRQYTRIAGRVPMIPRAFLGNWWSRYWKYTDKEFLEVADNFERLGVPLAVMVIDMDWHLVNHKGQYHWTGYTWNKELFPDPEQFITELHNRGLLTSINLHPAGGVKPHEEAYHSYANFIGAQKHAKAQKNLPFDLTDPLQASAYFKTLLHPQEAMGQPEKSFWWIDWQQGSKSRIQGVDPLFQLNHLHFLDLARDGIKRSAVFSRYPGRGGHRYPIGFSGDTHVTWNSLAFQPFLTASSACCAYFYYSHDIGGHFGGIEDPDLYLRWVQWGCLSPIMRLHSNQNTFHSRAPWNWDKETCFLASEAMKFRHQLIPYLYSAVYRAMRDAEPPIAPMYLRYPDKELAYNVPAQYLLGNSLVCAPIVTPPDPDTRLSRQVIWLPPLRCSSNSSASVPYRHFWSGEALYPGLHAVHGGRSFIPLYLKPGGIAVLADEASGSGLERNYTGPPKALTAVICAGLNGDFELFEDNENWHESPAFMTRVSSKWEADGISVSIGAAQIVEEERAKFRKCTAVNELQSVIPKTRKWTIRIVGVCALLSDSVGEVSYNQETECCLCVLNEVETIKGASVRFTRRTSSGGSEKMNLLSTRDRAEENIEAMLRSFFLGSTRKKALLDNVKNLANDPSTLSSLQKSDDNIVVTVTPRMKRALFEVVWGGGVERAFRSCPNAPFVAWQGRAESLPVKVDGETICGHYIRSVQKDGGEKATMKVQYGDVCQLDIPLCENFDELEVFGSDIIKVY